MTIPIDQLEAWRVMAWTGSLTRVANMKNVAVTVDSTSPVDRLFRLNEGDPLTRPRQSLSRRQLQQQ
jgi:hypothetical protein